MAGTEIALNIPGGDILFARLAQRLLESGDVDEATKICEKGLRKFPTYAQAHYILARCYMKQHKSDEARTELERVLRYDPNHYNAIKDLSSIYFINGFQDLYKEYLMKLFVLCPLSEEIIDEVKKLGDFEKWSPVQDTTMKIDLPPVPRIQEKETSISADIAEPPGQQKDSPVGRVILPDKVDLSQFDNLQDDFTTILHGNIDHSAKRNMLEDNDFELIKNREDIFAEESISTDADDDETMDELLGDNEELVIKEIKESPVDQEKSAEPEIIITADRDQTKTDHPAPVIKATPEPAAEPIDFKEMPPAAAAIPEKPVSDFDHLQDDEVEKFERPKIISQTLGEILVSQKKYAEAKSVFEALKEKHPQNKSLDVKIAYLDKIIGLEKTEKH